jgi:hypothetical protein
MMCRYLEKGFTTGMAGRSTYCHRGGRRVTRGWLYSYLDRQEGEGIASEIFSPESD